ncbi:MAG: HYR domain-containing protein [Anaerolineae bacterium]|nr:HYR domain-containing protein [Anaerolineae bacterium]MBL8106015.1 HYR domain-containing protein [Anaerolineales bacterium]MCC7190205.1 HYR domain-containing protein [Anaerolineales bacterium]
MPHINRRLIWSIFIILTVISNLLNVHVVLADDPTPTPPPTEEPTQPPVEATELPVEPTATELPEATPTAEPTAEPTSEEVPATEEAPVFELVANLPQDTDVVILDENGNPLSLASAEAATVLVEADPIWCPASQAVPTPGANGCTTNQTITSLLTLMRDNMGGSFSQDGIIYLERPGGPGFTTPLILSDNASSLGSSFTSISTFNMTIQGGWNGNNPGAITGDTNFGTSGPNRGFVQIGSSGNPWTGNVTLRDITVNDNTSTTNPSVAVYTTTGSVTMNDVDVNNADNSASVHVATNSGNVTLGGVDIADGEDNHGINVTTNSGTININNSSVDNQDDGNAINVTSNSGSVTLSGVDVDDSGGGNAVNITTTSGPVTLSDTDVSNQQDGFTGNILSSSGNISVTGGSAFDGDNTGGDTNQGFTATTSTGTISISNTSFNEAYGATAGTNYNGATLSAPIVTLNSVTALNNDLNGIAISNVNQVTLNNVTAWGNGTDVPGGSGGGAYTNDLGSGVRINGNPGSFVSVLDGVYFGNQRYGIEVFGTSVFIGSAIDLCQSVLASGGCMNTTPVTDTSAPVITFVSRTPANGAGWNNTDVTVTWSCVDAQSGVVAATVNQTVTTEGTNQSATGTCANRAGLTASNTQNGINIDKTAPTITFSSRLPAANGNGWNTSDVTVTWSCTNSLSPILSGTVTQTLSAEGAGQSATGTCQDAAGNSASDTQSGINIDKTAPTGVTLTPSGTLGNNGWHISDVTITTTGTESVSGPLACTGVQSLTTDTAGVTFNGSCTNLAGLTSNATPLTLKRDATNPIITFLNRTPANGNGWNNGDVTLNWSCADAMSGPVNATITQTVTTEGANQSSTANCVDNAGNTVSDTQSGINIDKSAPGIVASRTPAANGNGWNNTDVTVTFTGSDSGSGLASCTAPVTLSAEGAGQSATGTCADLAGNSSSTTVNNINIDKTAPTATATASPAPNGNGWNNTDVTVSFSGTDGLSGIDTCASNILLNTEGAGQSATGTCADLAGNVSAPATASGINIDKTNPVLSLPANIIVEATGVSGAVVNYSASASDNLDPAPTFGCSQSSGSTFPLGITTVSCTSTDQAGNSSVGSFTITVQDTTAPTLPLPADMTVEATSAAGAVVNFSATANDIVDGALAVTCAPPSGSAFAIATTSVACSASDSSGNAVNGSFNVTVQDTTPPVISPMANIVVDTSSKQLAPIFYSTPTTTDAVDGPGVATCVPPSGSLFPHGTTIVTCTAIDSHGNTSSITFAVLVEYIPKPATPNNGSFGGAILVTGGAPFDLDCATKATFFGITLKFYNLCDYQAVINTIDASALPAALPNGFTLVKGLDIAILNEGKLIKPLPQNTGIQMGFPLPTSDASKYTVLHWNNGQWEEITQPLSDGAIDNALATDAPLELYSLTSSSNSAAQVLTTELTGVFVLVEK